MLLFGKKISIRAVGVEHVGSKESSSDRKMALQTPCGLSLTSCKSGIDATRTELAPLLPKFAIQITESLVLKLIEQLGGNSQQ